MAVMTLSAQEILNRAMEIETKAKKFYDGAAAVAADVSARSVFETLSLMEANHLETFRDIERHLTKDERETEACDPGNEMLYYLDQFKEIQAWEMDPLHGVRGEGLRTEELLRGALEAEKETVFFYTFLYDYVPADRGLDKVAAVIREERSHVAMLQNVLDKRISLAEKH